MYITFIYFTKDIQRLYFIPHIGEAGGNSKGKSYEGKSYEVNSDFKILYN